MKENYFTSNEWIFLADVFNGALVEDQERENKALFLASCEDAERLDGTASRHGVEIGAFLDKARALSGQDIKRILGLIELYWAESDTVNLKEWAERL